MYMLEYIIVFGVIYLCYYFLVVKNNKKYDNKKLLVELVYLKKIYKE